ncbi:MAG: hypothetical protein AB8B72_00270 [Crocinitomicaceae bacterium]
MKSQTISILLLLFLSSCLSPNSNNFHRRKYLKLHTKQEFGQQKKEGHSKSIDRKEIESEQASYHEAKTVEEAQSDTGINSPPTAIPSNHGTSRKRPIKHATISNDLSASNSAIRTDNRQKTNKIRTNKTAKQQSFKNKRSALHYFLILLGLPVLSLRKNRTANITKWASKNVSSAQLLIGTFTVLGSLSSFFLGNVFQLQLSPSMILAPMVLGSGAVALSKLRVARGNHILKNRVSYALMGSTSFFGTFAMGSFAPPTNLVRAIEDPMIMPPAAAVFLTLLMVILLLLSVSGIALLACNLACSGYAVLALVLYFGGTFIASFLATLAILQFFRRESTRDKNYVKTALLVAGILTVLPLVISIIGPIIGFFF